MNAALLRTIASTVLYTHFVVLLFNVFWLVAVPLGAWRGWTFVRIFGWRAAHVISLGVVALQALAGSLCFLTNWQNDLLIAAGGPAEKVSMIERLIMRAVFWPLPMWAFIVLYVAALAYAVVLWWVVPPSAIGD